MQAHARPLLDRLTAVHRDLDIVYIESGGDNLATTFSLDLADLTICVISVCQGEKIPRKGGAGITRSDLVVVNKTDLAPHVGARLDVMEADTIAARDGRAFIFTDLSRLVGVSDVSAFVVASGGLAQD